MNNYDTGLWIKMPLSELLTPRSGRVCKGPSWWAVTPDECVLFYQTYASPQCNENRSIAERVAPGLEVRFIEMAFVPYKRKDY